MNDAQSKTQGDANLMLSQTQYAIKKIYEQSCFAVMELIGLYGYMYLSEDVEPYFETISYCTSIFTKVISEIRKYIPELDDVVFRKHTIQSLIDRSSTTSIYDIGNAFMQFYIDAFESIQSLKPYFGGSTLKPVPDNVVNKAYIIDMLVGLAPYIIKAPIELKEKTNIEYLTCIEKNAKTDTLLQCNPLSKMYIVLGYIKNQQNIYEAVKVLQIVTTPLQSYYDFKQTEMYFVSDAYTWHLNFYPNTFSKTFVEFYDKNTKPFFDLLNIPLAFHRWKKPTFKVYADYTLNICKLMNNDSETSVYVKQAQRKIYDFLTLEEQSLIPKYTTIIDLHSRKHMWNTLHTVGRVDADFYIDNIQNFTSLPYTLNASKNAIVRTPLTYVDVTKEYQHAQLLAKMLCNRQIPYLDYIISDFSYFETYYKIALGQDSEFRQIVFQNLYTSKFGNEEHLKIVDGISIINYIPKGLVKENEIFERIKNTICLFIAYYLVFMPLNGTSFYERMFSITAEKIFAIVRTSNILEDVTLNYKHIHVYKEVVSKIPQMVCFESFCNCFPEFQVTEITKEFYLLVDIKREFIKRMLARDRNYQLNFTLNNPINQSDGMIFTHVNPMYYVNYKEFINNIEMKNKVFTKLISNAKQVNITIMIDILNETFSFLDENTKLNYVTDPKSYIESIPRAVEYLGKIGLIDEHVKRMQEFKMFEILLDAIMKTKAHQLKLQKLVFTFLELHQTDSNIYQDVVAPKILDFIAGLEKEI